MANKMLALVGPGTGPLMHTARFVRLVACINGLSKGKVTVEIFNFGQKEMRELGEGETELPKAEFVRFSHVEEKSQVLCTLRGYHAVHSA